ncbi:apolipoprotein D-like [Argiope bruennichi]|uniref:Apolipoprotein D like protein n=1 Tax=Argiope bruennichi TaxID=94029 RepID=A0A8T0G015_ARGBR|nr:apolipoprotein D-like [Argiope bruennichi]KAF8794493.1 Apolipoprotein D like protein [Argiope bruennichi]
MSVGLIAVLTLSVIAGCYGNTFKMGACPRVVVMDQFDFDRYSGEWYVIQRFNPMATCTKYAIEKGPDGVYTVNETSRPLGLNFGFHQQYIKARKINFLRNDTTSIFRLERNLVHFTLSTFGVVDTDYVKYAIVWGCDPVLFGSVQNVDILSRQPTLDTDTIKKAKDTLKEMHIDTSPLDNVDHSHCGNSGNGDGSEGEGNANTNNIVAG